MNKRLISVLLAAVMLVAIIPSAFITNAAAADPESIKTVASAESIELDGELDDAYKHSQKIVPNTWHTGTASTVYFEAYTVLTVRGIYIWAEIKDETLDKSAGTSAGSGDKFQIYLKLDNGTQDTWGWYEFDYNGNASLNTQGSIALSTATVTAKKLADGSGWRSESFIPYGNIDPLNIYGLKLSIGLQVNNEVSGGTRYGLCYSNSNGTSFWSNSATLTPLSISVLGDVYRDGTREKTAVYVTEAPAVDGTKDSSYSDHAKITIRNIVTGTGFSNDTRTELGDLYLSFTDSALYAYYEVYDKDLTASDYCQFYYSFNNNGSPRSGYFCTKINPEGDAFYGNTSANYGYPGTSYTASEVTVARKALGSDRYSVEVKIPIPVQDRTALKNSGKIDINFAFSVNDYAPDGPAEDEDTNPDRRAYGGCESVSASMYNYNVNGYRFPKLTLSKSFTDATPAIIEGASVALGSDISVKYYVTICPEDVDNAYMKFIRNGKEYIAYPKASNSNAGSPRECVFVCEDIAPQAIGDNIRAELYIDETLVAFHDGYSVRQNCLNIYNNEAYKGTSYNNMKWLINALLNYGAAAQEYIGYNTETLANKDCEMDLLSPEAVNNVKSVGTPISSTVKMTALGVQFDNVNRVYVKFTAPSISDITVVINGKPASIQKVAGETDIYIAYSEAISVLKFGFEYRIVLSNGTASQTAVYSVNSYAYAKYNTANSAMAKLAKATYTYGEYARKYANVGIGSYKVLTFNDGDASYADKQNYNRVAEIINYYAPDLVGMQEVQQAHANGENSFYAKLLPDYGIIYFDHGYPNTTVINGLGEKNNPYGNPIFYRKDRFNLIDCGRRWLSETPDVASRVEGSEWTRTYAWAKLQDKRTGEMFVFVNTHIDYSSAAGLEQVKILLSLTAEQFGGLPIIYTADWNFGSGSDSYKYMNSKGYYATETLMTNAYKPASTIDACFVNSGEFMAFDYKYIKSHGAYTESEFYETISDHPAILTEIAPVKRVNQLPLPGEIIIEGPFDSEEDLEGFN